MSSSPSPMPAAHEKSDSLVLQHLDSLIMTFLKGGIDFFFYSTGLTAVRNVKRNPSCKLRNAFNHSNRKGAQVFHQQATNWLHFAVTPHQRTEDIRSSWGGFNAVSNKDNNDFKTGVLEYGHTFQEFSAFKHKMGTTSLLLSFRMLFSHDNLSENQTDPDTETQAVTLWFPVWGKDSIWQEMMQQHSWQEQDQHNQKSLKDFFLSVAPKQCSMCVYKKQEN